MRTLQTKNLREKTYFEKTYFDNFIEDSLLMKFSRDFCYLITIQKLLILLDYEILDKIQSQIS